MERPLELKNSLSKHTDGYVADVHPNVSPEPESYNINKLITTALIILVLSGIIWPFYSKELKIEALVPLINPEISKTSATTVTPITSDALVTTVTSDAPVTTVTSDAPVTTVTSDAPVTTVTPIVAVPEAQPTDKKIAIKLDRSRGFLSLNQGVLTIKPGDEVIWVNDGLDRVILVSSDGLFEAKSLDSDKRMNYTFKKTGTYSFYLEENKNMTLTVIVEP